MTAIVAKKWQSADIAYCSNVHPGESVEEIVQNLTTLIAPVRHERGLETMTTGLWISAAAARQLRDKQTLSDFRQAMDSAGLSLTSINGFPFGGFHQQQVKADVYLPDWSDPQRLQYSKDLADILASSLPDECRTGAISTVPLGYKTQWTATKQQLAIKHLTKLADYLHQLKQQTGKHILLCLEMEPDCVLESTVELVDFFQQDVQRQIPNHQYLGVCYDVCHQAVMYENAYEALNLITQAGITIGKIQLSSALRVDFASAIGEDESLLDVLAQFSEPKYLHQVKTVDNQGTLHASNDLSTALAGLADVNAPLSQSQQWRIHFHVPINSRQLSHPKLQTTRDDLLRVFDFLKDHPAHRPWLEVETYSWQVLPAEHRPKNEAKLIIGIVNELRWVELQLAERGLLG